MAFTNGNDINLLQPSDAAVVGAGAGNDVYIVSPDVLTVGQRVTVSDTQGVNTLRLTGDLTVLSSRATGSSVELTLSNGAVVAILDANAFRFELGGEGLDAAPVVQTFAQLLTQTLGFAVVPPASAGVVANLTPTFVQPDGRVTRTAAPPPPPPQELVTKLTPQTDTLEGDANDNLFTASLTVNPALTTLNPLDILNGGAGQDTLRVTAAADFAGFAPNRGMINFEVLELLNGADTPRNFDATGIVGLERIEILANDNSVSFTELAGSNLPLAVRVTDLQAAKTVTLEFAEDAAIGINDAVSFELGAVGRLATPSLAEAVVNLRADDIELLTLTSLSGVSVVDATTGGSRLLEINGPGDLRVVRVDPTVQIVQADSAEGDLSLFLNNIAANTLQSVTLGKGDDMVRIASEDLRPDAQLAGGDGRDELIFTRPSLTQDPTITGFETVRLVDTNENFNFSPNNSTGMDTLIIERGIAGGTKVSVNADLPPLEEVILAGTSQITPGVPDGTLRYLIDGALQVTASKDALSGSDVDVTLDAPLLDALTLDVQNGVTYEAPVSIASADQFTLNVAANATYRGVLDARSVSSVVVSGLADEVTFSDDVGGSRLGQAGQLVTVDATEFEGQKFDLDISTQQDLIFQGGQLGQYFISLTGDRGVLDLTGGINNDVVELDNLGAGPHDYRIDLGTISDNDDLSISTKAGVAAVDLSGIELVGVDFISIAVNDPNTTVTLPDGVAPGDVSFSGVGRVEVISTPQDEIFDFADLNFFNDDGTINSLDGVYVFQPSAATNGFDEIRSFSASDASETLDLTAFNDALLFTPTGTTALMAEQGLFTKNPMLLGRVDVTDEIVRLIDIADGQDITTAEGLTTALRQGGEFANLNVKDGSALFMASQNETLSDTFLFYVNAGADGLETATAVGVVRTVGVGQFSIDDFEGAMAPEMMGGGLGGLGGLGGG
jgi:hypothetical protein